MRSPESRREKRVRKALAEREELGEPVVERDFFNPDRSQEQLRDDIEKVFNREDVETFEKRDVVLFGDPGFNPGRKGLWQNWREKVAEDGGRR